MKKGIAELTADFRAIMGETVTEQGVTFLEDLTDSMTEAPDTGAEWETRYNDLLKRYADRFGDDGSGKPDGKQAPEPEDKPEPEEVTYDDLFEDKKGE